MPQLSVRLSQKWWGVVASLEADDAAAAGAESALFGVEESGLGRPGRDGEDKVVDFIADFAEDGEEGWELV